jgi:inorganic phosphate transporter, PiT family
LQVWFAAAWAAESAGAIQAGGIVDKVILPAIISPALAFAVAGVAIILVYRAVGRRRPGVVSRGFRLGQVLSSGALSLSHGTNDGQKTIGVMTLALVAQGAIPAGHVHVPTSVILCSASAMAFGTYAGGWRIMAGASMGRWCCSASVSSPCSSLLLGALGLKPCR